MTDPLEPNEPGEPAPPQPVWKPTPPKGPYRPSPLPGILAGLALGAVLVGAGLLLAQMLPKPEPAAPAPAPAPASAAEVKSDPVAALTTQVDGLGKRLDDLQKQLAALPKPEPAPDLKPIEAKVDALAKQVASAGDTKGIDDKVAQASAAVAAAQTKLDALARASAARDGDVAALKDRVKLLAEARPAATAPAANANAEADYARAVDLFRKNQFAPARDAFARLQESMPNDARVWYYSALSNGYATNVWNGETERLVNKGREVEKAGGDPSKINAAFADLPAQTKNWLDAFRSR
jgi:TolA-binding protein